VLLLQQGDGAARLSRAAKARGGLAPVAAPAAPARDFVGYGGDPPHADWPSGARIAVNFVLNYEEGSEPSIADGDGRTETGLTETSQSRLPPGERDLAAESMFEYGSRAGFWRIARLFQARKLPLTIFGCALALERNPAAARHIRDSGWDVCCHGWRWVEHYRLDEAEERAHIARAVASLRGTVGERPLGWYCRYGPSPRTRDLIAEEGGFLYDSDSYADDLPYWVAARGRPHLVVPYSLVTNDSKIAGGLHASESFYQLLKDAFDVLYAEGAERPKMMSVGLHMRLVGHPARIAGLARFLDHVAAHERAWVTRRIDIARHWAERHPAR
jgi:putative urate catabolism protein